MAFSFKCVAVEENEINKIKSKGKSKTPAWIENQLLILKQNHKKSWVYVDYLVQRVIFKNTYYA